MSNYVYITENWDYAWQKKDDERKGRQRNFPGSPVVTTSPSSAGGAGFIPDQGTKIPYDLGHKTKT